MISLLLVFARMSTACADDALPATKPFDVLDRAISRWQARPRPTLLSYTVDFTGSHGAKTYRRRYRVGYAASTHETHVTVIGSEGPAPPFVAPEKQRLSPVETFGFVSRDEPLAAVSPSPDATTLPVIAAVRAVSRYPYDVSLVGEELVDEQRAYHMTLQPRQTPDAYPLRELWIDAMTYDVLKIVALQFEQLGPIRVPYLVTAMYGSDGPYWLIHHATAGAAIHAGIFSYSSDAQAAFEDFQYAPHVPQ